ncbi:MAG: hypothetical protein WAV07_16595 [Candidatus Contendobacter sp.]
MALALEVRRFFRAAGLDKPYVAMLLEDNRLQFAVAGPRVEPERAALNFRDGTPTLRKSGAACVRPNPFYR